MTVNTNLINLRTRRGILRGAMAGGGLALAGTLLSRSVIAQAPREIEMVAKRFSFTPKVVQLKVGESVVLAIKSLDFIHGFSLPDLKLRADLLPGRITRIAFTPSKPGVLEFVCDNFCGDDHEEMHGEFVVQA
jgi:cytochrome c oxidase subunit II